MEKTEVAARGDYSISELRTMMTTPAESTTVVPVEGTEAAAAEPTESEPASGTDDTQERGADGKFKSPKPESETEENDTPGVKKRIGKALQKQREAEQRASEAERKLAEFQGSRPAAESGKPAQPAAEKPNDKPVLKDYETYEAFNEDLVKWTVEQREAEREIKKRAADQQTAQRQLDKAHGDRIAAAKEKYSDWDEKIGTLTVPISQELHNAIVESELGPEVVYYVANHPEEGDRISKLSPARQIAEFGKLEARIEAASAPSGTKTEKRPLPRAAANVGGGSSSAGKEPNLSDPNLPMAAFKREVGRRLKRAA